MCAVLYRFLTLIHIHTHTHTLNPGAKGKKKENLYSIFVAVTRKLITCALITPKQSTK